MTARISDDLELAVGVLRGDGIVAIPTETVYGLAARALSREAVEKVFEAKGRPRSHPLIVHVENVERARMWGVLDERAEKLAAAFWPGPLTILVPRRQIVPDWVTGGRDTVAIRIPDHVAALAILGSLDEALVAPSANRFGKVSPTSPQHVLDDLAESIDLVVDGGSCEVGVESTIVELVDGVQILRPGAITAEQIQQVIEEGPNGASGPARAPGMLTSHYSPDTQVELCDTVEEARSLIARHRGTCELVHEPDVSAFARSLYGRLRAADRDDVDLIVVVRAPQQGLGIAINDRLEKAAAPVNAHRPVD